MRIKVSTCPVATTAIDFGKQQQNLILDFVATNTSLQQTKCSALIVGAYYSSRNSLNSISYALFVKDFIGSHCVRIFLLWFLLVFMSSVTLSCCQNVILSEALSHHVCYFCEHWIREPSSLLNWPKFTR